MESTPIAPASIRRLGWITQILGALALLRWAPEVPLLNPTWGRGYWGAVWTDLILGLLAVAAGWAFRTGKNGSRAAICLYWGAGTARSAAMVIWLHSFKVTEVWRHQGITPGDFLTDSRFLIYVLTLIAAPDAFWTLGVLPEPHRPSRRARWAWTMAGAACALVFFFSGMYRP